MEEKLGFIGESSVQTATFNWRKKAAATAVLGGFYDGTAKNKSGNAVNYPETIGPDLHSDCPALPVFTYEADVGYFVDGTAITAVLKHDRS